MANNLSSSRCSRFPTWPCNTWKSPTYWKKLRSWSWPSTSYMFLSPKPGRSASKEYETQYGETLILQNQITVMVGECGIRYNVSRSTSLSIETPMVFLKKVSDIYSQSAAWQHWKFLLSGTKRTYIPHQVRRYQFVPRTSGLALHYRERVRDQNHLPYVLFLVDCVCFTVQECSSAIDHRSVIGSVLTIGRDSTPRWHT